MRGAGSTRKAANCAIAITAERLGNRAICTADNACAAKVSLVDVAIGVHRATTDIQHASDVIAIAMDR